MRLANIRVVVILFACALLLALPATREVICIEASSLWPGARLFGLYPLLRDGRHNSASPMRAWQLAAQAFAENPDDWQIATGASLAVRDQKLQVARAARAVELAPNEPAARSALALAYIRQLFWHRREMYPHGTRYENVRHTLLVARDTYELRETLEQLDELEPDNGAADMLLAWLEYGLGNDVEGNVYLFRAAHKPRLDLHVAPMQAAAARAVLAGMHEMPEFERYLLVGSAYARYNNHHKLFNMARVAAYLGEEERRAGDTHLALAAWRSTITLGRRMRLQATDASEARTGALVEMAGASLIYDCKNSDDAVAPEEIPLLEEYDRHMGYYGGNLYAGEAFDLFVEERGIEEAAQLLAHVHQAKRMISKSVNYSAGQWDNAALLRGASQVMVGALALAFLLGVAVLFAFSFILRLWRPRGAEKLPGKWAALLGFMVVVPLLVLWLHRIFGEAPPAQALFYRNGIFTPFAIIVLLNCVGMLALAWLLAGWLVALRSRGEISLAAGLAAGGHALLGACLVALILFYAVHTAHLAWLRTRAVNELTAAAQGDLARFHQDHPELFAEPDLGPYLEIVEGAREMEAAREDAVLEERSEPSGQ